MLCWAAYTVGSRSLLTRHSPLVVTGFTMTIGSALYAPFGVPSLLRLDWTAVSWWAWALLVYSAVFALVVAYLIWYTAVQRVGNNRTSIYSNVVPLVAMAVAAAVLGEPITARKIAGAPRDPRRCRPHAARAAVGGGHSLRRHRHTLRPVSGHSCSGIDSASSHGLEWTHCAPLPPAARRCARSWSLDPFRPAAAAGDNPPSSPLPTPNPPTRNPCLTADIDGGADRTGGPRCERERRRSPQAPRPGSRRRSTRPCVRQPLGSTRPHRRRARCFSPPPRAATEDVGDVAVIQDAGDLLTPPNPFDLTGVGLRFTRNGSSYDVSRISGAFRSGIGSRIQLEDDDSMPFTLPFNFPVVWPGPASRVRQLGRQHHVRGGRPREHRAQRLARDDRPATRGAVLRRSRSVDGQRARVRAERGGRVHRHLVHRPGVRQGRDRHRAGEPAAERERRVPVRPDASSLAPLSSGSRPGVPVALRRSISVRPEPLTGGDGGDRRAVLTHDQPRPRRNRPQVLRDAPGRLRSAGHLDGRRRDRRRVCLRNHGGERDPRHRPGRLRPVARVRKRLAGCAAW